LQLYWRKLTGEAVEGRGEGEAEVKKTRRLWMKLAGNLQVMKRTTALLLVG